MNTSLTLKPSFAISATRLRLVIPLVAMLVVGCGANSTSVETSTSTAEAPPPTVVAQWEIYDSVEQLAAKADLVVIGTVGSEFARYPFVEPGVEGGPSVTDIIHTVTMEQLLGTSLNDSAIPKLGSKIFVSYSDLGGPVGNITPFKEGETLVFFLESWTFRSPGLEPLEGWGPIQSDSGIFDVHGAEVTARTSVGPMHGARFTLADLTAEVQSVLQEGP